MLPPSPAFSVFRIVFFIYQCYLPVRYCLSSGLSFFNIQMLPFSQAFSVFRFIFFIYTNVTSRPGIFCLQVYLFYIYKCYLPAWHFLSSGLSFLIYKCYLLAWHFLSSGLSFFYIQMFPPGPAFSVFRFAFFFYTNVTSLPGIFSLQVYLRQKMSEKRGNGCLCYQQ